MAERFKRDRAERVYRSYVTDSLQLIPQGAYLVGRWADIGKQAADDLTAEEIAEKVIEDAGLEVVE